MGRIKRVGEAGAIYHMLSRANRLATVFQRETDSRAFERILTEVLELVVCTGPMTIWQYLGRSDGARRCNLESTVRPQKLAR